MLDVIEVSQRVEKGAALLDLKFPEWLDAVDLSYFDLSDYTCCVLAFSSGVDYLTGAKAVFDTDDFQVADDRAPDYGFSIECDTTAAEEKAAWDLLQSAWVGLITVRRSRAKAHGAVG